MNRIFLVAAVAATLSLGPRLMAQFGPENRYSPGAVNALVDRVHDDLNHAYGVWQFSGADRDRLNDAEKQLREFSRKWDQAHFDKGNLDSSIGSIQHVLDNNHLPPQDRDALSDDVTQLRRMRDAYDRHEIGY
jgi:hypothetical protein